MSNQITLKSGGQSLSLGDGSFQPALKANWVAMGARAYVATVLFGWDITALKKAPDTNGKVIGKSMKEILAELTAGKSEAEVATITTRFNEGRKAYNVMLDEYAKRSNQANALLATDPNFKKVTRPVFNAKGAHTGSFITRYQPVKASGAAAKIAALEAEVARLRGAALPAPAVA